MIAENSLAELRSIVNCLDVCTDILGLDVVKKNGKYFICCPFHSDTHPSCQVNISYVYCYSCHQSADAIKLVCKVLGCEWWEAVKKLESYYGLDLKSEDAAPLPVVALRAEALRYIGIEDKQLLKQLHSENSLFFWRFLKNRAIEARNRYAAIEKELPSCIEISGTLSERRRGISDIIKLADATINKKPNEYVLKIC